MASNPGIQKPGKKFGPCKGQCSHKDCSQSRSIATICVCRLCNKVIGWEAPFYMDPDAAPLTLDDLRYVHADCLEDSLSDKWLGSVTGG